MKTKDFDKVKEIFYAMNETDRKFFNHSTELKQDISDIYMIHRKIIDDIAVCELFWLDIQQSAEQKYAGFSIMVHPEHRNKRIATELIEEILKICDEKKISTLSIDVYENNVAMINLLHKFKFKREYSHNDMVLYTFYF